MSFRRVSARLAWGVWFLSVAGVTALWTVRVLVQSGGAVTIPNLVGKTVAEAQYLLRQRNLALGTAGSEFSNDISRGSVLTQSVTAGEEVRTGRTILVSLSRGPRERSALRVIGLDREAAFRILENSEVKPVVAGTACSDPFPSGSVIAQEPRPGHPMDSDRISLLLSSGKCADRFLLSDVIGRPLAEVLRALDEERFVIRSVRYTEAEEYPRNVVFQVQPPAGTIVRPLDAIALFVAKGTRAVWEQTPHDVGRWVWLSLHSPVGFSRRAANLWVERGDFPPSCAIDFLLAPGENSELALWLPPGSSVVLKLDGRETWRKTY